MRMLVETPKLTNHVQDVKSEKNTSCKFDPSLVVFREYHLIYKSFRLDLLQKDFG